MKVPNREIKTILENRISLSRKDWAFKLDEVLWAYQTALKTPLEQPPPLSLSMESHVIYLLSWSITLIGLSKTLNMDYENVGKKRKLQLNELEKLRLDV